MYRRNNDYKNDKDTIKKALIVAGIGLLYLILIVITAILEWGILAGVIFVFAMVTLEILDREL